jgi:hypothetical protein
MKNYCNFSIVIILCMLFAQALGYADSVTLPVQEPPNRELLGLKIVSFVEYSALEMAGAQVGDVITHYNGIKLESLDHLLTLRDGFEQDEVEVVLRRGVEEIKVIIPRGLLGAQLQEIAPEHRIDNDAVIIDGIGHLGWGLGMENSFLGCVTLLEEKYGSKLSYHDILGLSGYGFRFHFYPGSFCGSSVDATCGHDIGGEILGRLGYEFERNSLPETDKANREETVKAKEQLLRKIKASIDAGWPVLALDLINIEEWGIITGYQKSGTELFCRTYFDMTEGYEIAQKFPWVIYAIRGKREVDLKSEYRKSLSVAKELLDKENYGEHANGINAIKIWRKALLDEKFFKSLDEKQLYNTMHINWWTYYSLAEARVQNNMYLTANKEKFGVDEKVIESLAQLMEKESALLQNGFNSVPSTWEHPNPSVWTQDLRRQQTETLEDFLKLEEQVRQILRTKIK